MSRYSRGSTSSSSQSSKSSKFELTPRNILYRIKPGAKFENVERIQGSGDDKVEAKLIIDKNCFQACGRTKLLAKETTAAKALHELWNFTFKPGEDGMPKIILSDETLDKINLPLEANEKFHSFILETFTKSLRIDNGYIQQNFDIRKPLGSGSYGSVFEAQNKFDKGSYAIKMINMRIYDSDSEIIRKKYDEVIRLADCKHKNILTYHKGWLEIVTKETLYNTFPSSIFSNTGSSSDYSTEQANRRKRLNERIPSLNLYIQTELCCGNLNNWIENRTIYQSYNYQIELGIFKDLLKALEYLHNKNILHRDIKPNNVFTVEKSKEVKVKLGDFGLARELHECDDESKLTSAVGTQPYAAPEIETGKYNFSSDIFSLGIIAVRLFSDISTAHEFYAIINNLKTNGKLPESLLHNHPAVVKLVEDMTDKDADKRPMAKDILLLDVFSGVKKKSEEITRLKATIEEKDKEIISLKEKISSLTVELEENHIDKIDLETYAIQCKEKSEEIAYLKELIDSPTEERITDTNRSSRRTSSDHESGIYVKPSKILKLIRSNIAFSSPEQVGIFKEQSIKITIQIGKTTYKGFGSNKKIAKECVSAEVLLQKWNFKILKYKNELPIIDLSKKAISSVALSSEKKIKVYRFILKEFTSNFPKKTGEFQRDFRIIKQLGQGGYGKVFKVEKKIDNETYAVKRVKIYFDDSDETVIRNTLREVSQLARCQPTNIVRYYTAWLEIENNPSSLDTLYCSSDDLSSIGSWKSPAPLPFLCMYIQTEYCNGTLADWIDGRDRTSSPGLVEMKIIKDILSALNHIHNKNIMHRDIKPSNIFTIGDQTNIVVKLGDFGLARDLNETYQDEICLTSYVGSALYAAPETNTSKYNFSSDIFSLGIICFQLFGSISSQHELIDKVIQLKEKRQLPEDIRKNFPLISEMILNMTCPKVENRPSAKYLLSNNFFFETDISNGSNQTIDYKTANSLIEIIKSQREEIQVLRSQIDLS
ncbi:DgyrCDS653 [Dimorphilus gyrociliatus]|uniref:non-specific serine/threonine protein kinase n=1 Tax=Dimorphilus gyrociliatus TaxID=2664684 RepID=A0A7I8V538_9ANNE|nr:DgyrCDS653 [Dimorphilus gyrociliatus]